ncbi:MAG: hypothetical protein GXY83_17070, partial [Rhodopirellula sp.]|nr:hypothetical protein [Rhodopirellula sp.]
MSTVESVPLEQRERERSQLARQLRRARQDWEHFVRALSHDMNANFMLLDSSFRRLKDSLDA